EARPHGPYVIGGHCAGGLVALEIARRLLDAGEDVPLVFIVDASAPWQATRLYDGMAPGTPAARPARRRETARVAEPGAEPVSTPDAGSAATDTFGRYRRAIRRYAPMPLDVPLLLLRPERNRDLRPTLGWSALSKRVQVSVIRGDHHTAITRHVDEVARALQTALAVLPARVSA
ncbi:MAG: thioesterase domain-containing protein, partial [Betaproteobacteria bacterium]